MTKSFPNLWVRVFDSDGEFLLIEAAKVLPKWLSPEMDSNRVWIHGGKLFIVPLANESAISKSITLQEALRAIKTGPKSLVYSTFVEAEAFYRLEKYPSQITDSLHQSTVTIPRKLAYILHSRPKAIAPATEAFYLRDPIALKPLLSPSSRLLFPPTDLVTVSICFTKVLYAQLKSQRFDPPPSAWRTLLQSAEPDSSDEDKDTLSKLSRLEMGMKVTSGFEMLCKDGHTSKNRTTREVALLLDDLEEDGDSAALPTDEEIAQWKDVSREDDDSWMDINFADFEEELAGAGRNSKPTTSGQPGFGDATTQADLQKIVSRFEAFLNDDQAGIDGAELDEMDEDDDDTDEYSSEDDEDREVSFDEEQFARMMREMMGMPSTSEEKDTKQIPRNQAAPQRKDEEEDQNDHEEIQNLMQQMEKELTEAGALSLDPPSSSAITGDKQLLRENDKGKGKGKAREVSDSDEEDEDEGDQMVDIDYNLAKNLLESFKSQAGMAGPAGNILSLMGMKLPRDEGDDDDEEDDEGGGK